MIDGRWTAVPVSPLTSWCLTHLHSNWACLSQHSSLDKSNIWSVIYCLDWILYKWKAEQMQFSWILKCKYKDYTALFSKSLLVHCAVFWIPAHTSYIWKWDISLAVKETLLAWVAVLWAVLPVFTHHATGPAWLAAYRWKARISYFKTEHFAACLPQHKGTFMQAKRSAGH